MSPAAPPAYMRVQIVDPAHPHFPEHGELTGKIVSLFGKPMAEMKLDHCQHGTDACFIQKGQVEAERVIRRQRGGRVPRPRRRSKG